MIRKPKVFCCCFSSWGREEDVVGTRGWGTEANKFFLSRARDRLPADASPLIWGSVVAGPGCWQNTLRAAWSLCDQSVCSSAGLAGDRPPERPVVEAGQRGRILRGAPAPQRPFPVASCPRSTSAPSSLAVAGWLCNGD